MAPGAVAASDPAGESPSDVAPGQVPVSRHAVENEIAPARSQGVFVDLVVLDQAIDTTTPASRLLFYTLAAIAEFERDLIRERVIAGVRRARTLGKQLGRPRSSACWPVSPPTMTDRLGRSQQPYFDRPVWPRRALSTQRGLHVERQIIVALPREHDGPGGQSDLPLGVLGCKGAPGLEVKLLGEMYRQQPDGLQQGRCRDGQLDGGEFIHPGQPSRSAPPEYVA